MLLFIGNYNKKIHVHISINHILYNILGYDVEHTQFTVLKDVIIWYSILYLKLKTQYVPDSMVGPGDPVVNEANSTLWSLKTSGIKKTNSKYSI